MRARTYVAAVVLCTLPLAGALVVVSADLVARTREAGQLQGRQLSALECAQTGIGTDQSIADCYTSRGLPVPDDI